MNRHHLFEYLSYEISNWFVGTRNLSLVLAKWWLFVIFLRLTQMLKFMIATAEVALTYFYKWCNVFVFFQPDSHISDQVEKCDSSKCEKLLEKL